MPNMVYNYLEGFFYNEVNIMIKESFNRPIQTDTTSDHSETTSETISRESSPILDLIQPCITDPVCELYNDSTHGFVLARTFRSGDLYTTQSELAYLQNFPGYIMANPTTVISKKIRARTISQLPENDWTNEPSFLFTVRPKEGITIADYGLGSCNSFSSTQAIRLAMDQKNPPSGKFSYAQSLDIVGDYLRENWDNFLIDLERKYAELHLKDFDESGRDVLKKFLKQYSLFFNKDDRYDKLFNGLYGNNFSQDLLFKVVSVLIGQPHFKTSDSLSNMGEILEDAHNLTKITKDVPIEPHPIITLMEQANYKISRAEFQEKTTLKDKLKTLYPDSSSTEPSLKSGLVTEADNKMLNVDFQEENTPEGKLARLNEKEVVSQSMKNKTMHRLFFQATGALKLSNALAKKPPEQSKEERQTELFNEKNIYENYHDFIENASRHNELLSRVYPW
jgi:hypothetical protein